MSLAMIMCTVALRTPTKQDRGAVFRRLPDRRTSRIAALSCPKAIGVPSCFDPDSDSDFDIDGSNVSGETAVSRRLHRVVGLSRSRLCGSGMKL
jgi:hypothetical protein